MAVRERENIYRPDMINLLMQIRKQKLSNDVEKEQDISPVMSETEGRIKDGKAKADWTDDELVAQCSLFFIAGFLTTSTALSTLCHELAINPEIQERLIREIDDVYDKKNGKLTYESLQSMKYMTMVVSENLRKWPPSVFIERVCVKPLRYEDSTGLNVNFDKGTYFFAPIQAFHHDPKYFPNPEKFDPERFSEENIGNIVPFTYLPFGGGPRNCIASRFALMQMKAVMFYLLKNFKIGVTEKTQVPLKLTGIFLKSEKGIYLQLKNRSPVIGLFDYFTPFYFVRDPELIKQLTVKDFDHFTDRRFTDSSDSLFSSSLSVLKGQKWKDMRATLSPAFTGSKMRQMLELINESSKDLVKHFQKNPEDTKCVDMEDTFTRFTNDVIATCAFGIKINSLDDRDNEFYTMGKKLMNPNQALFMIKFLLVTAFPRLGKLLKIQIFGGDLDRFFRLLIMDTMAVRERENIFRPDMINLLMQIRKGNLTEDVDKDSDIFSVAGPNERVNDAKTRTDWKDDELVAQCLLFFIAGFSTTSTVLTTLSYELAVHKDVQDKLIEEIDDVYSKNNGKLTYETLQSMKYLGMVVSETLRKWPPAAFLERACTKPLKYEDPAGFNIDFHKGSNFSVPIHAIQNDPKYFPNPDKFDPERFSDANVDNIVPFSYIPFGVGPRSCIASRFALMQMKALIFYLLKDFKFEVCEKTQIPLKLTGIFMKPEKGVHLEIKKRI